MEGFSSLGKILILVGIVMIAVGAVLVFGAKIPWIGRLPGDFKYEGKNFTFYFPLATSILLSVILTLIFMFFGKK